MNAWLQNIAPSLIRELNSRKRVDSIDLGLGEPLLKPSILPFQAALDFVAEHGCTYSPNAGFFSLREKIAAHYGYPGLVDPNGVCITVGSQEALHVTIKGLVTPQQDEVLLVSPCYPLYRKLCMMEGIFVREVLLREQDGFVPIADLVLEQIKPHTKAILIASPNNPTGRVWSDFELKKLAQGLQQLGSHIYLVSDEVYQELYYTEKMPQSPAAYYENTIVINSLSKSCALTGLRLGWFLAPKQVTPTLQKVHQFAVSCADTFAQQVAISLFQNPENFSTHRGHYIKQFQYVNFVLQKYGLSFIPPEGSFYCLVRLQGKWRQNSLNAAFALLEEENVVTIPGVTFGAEGFLRISFVSSPEILEEGIARLARFLNV